jgi:hypothetical protein
MDVYTTFSMPGMSVQLFILACFVLSGAANTEWEFRPASLGVLYGLCMVIAIGWFLPTAAAVAISISGAWLIVLLTGRRLLPFWAGVVASSMAVIIAAQLVTQYGILSTQVAEWVTLCGICIGLEFGITLIARMFRRKRCV